MPDSIGRASLLTILGSYLSLPLAIAGGIVLARVAGPEVKGLFTVFTVTQGFLVLPGVAIQVALTHFVAHYRPSSSAVWPRIRWVIVVQSLVSVGVLAVLLLLPPIQHVLFPGLNEWYLIPVLIFVTLNLWYLYRSAVVSGLQQYSLNAIAFYAAGLASSAVFVVVLSAWWIKGYAPTVGWVIAASLAGSILAVLVWIVLTSGVRTFAGETIPASVMVREMVDLGGPVLLRGVLEWANLRLDVYFVTFFAGAGALGVYTVAVGVSQQLWTIPFSIAVPLFSRISREGDSTGSRETARYAFRILILMSLALTAVAAIAAPILIPLAYGSRFSGAIALLLLLLPGVVAISPTRALASYFTGIGRPSEPLIAEAIGVIATTTLDWTLIPRYGASGAAIASSVAYCAFSAYLTYRFKRVSQSRWSDLLSIRRQDITSVWRRLMDLIPGRMKRFASSAGRYP